MLGYLASALVGALIVGILSSSNKQGNKYQIDLYRLRLKDILNKKEWVNWE